MTPADALAILELAICRLMLDEAPWPVRARRVFRPLVVLSVVEPHALPAELAATLQAVCADVRAGAHRRDPAGAQAVVSQLLSVHAVARAYFVAIGVADVPADRAAGSAC